MVHRRNLHHNIPFFLYILNQYINELKVFMKHGSTLSDKGAHELSHPIPKGIWLPFDFGDSHPVSLNCENSNLLFEEEKKLAY
jgi:hypothetical protein